MTDCEFLLNVLADGEPHTLNEILQRSFNDRGCGLTVHSRVADLRKHGHLVEHENVPGAQRGNASTYRLVSLAEPEAIKAPTTEPHHDSGSASAADLTLFPGERRGAYTEAA